jgi:hypothetical protein
MSMVECAQAIDYSPKIHSAGPIQLQAPPLTAQAALARLRCVRCTGARPAEARAVAASRASMMVLVQGASAPSGVDAKLL